MHPTLLLTFLFCSANLLVAQGVEKGYIVSLSGDTLYGFLQDSDYESLSQTVVFKPSRKAPEPNYSPTEIQAFGFRKREHFVSHLVSFSLRSDNGWEAVSKQCFLLRIENGPLQLFELKDGQDQPLFLKNENGPLQLLCFGNDGSPEYLNTLKAATESCEALEIPFGTKPELSEIQPVVQNFNRCDRLREQKVLPKLLTWGYAWKPINNTNLPDYGWGFGFSTEYRPFDRGFLGQWTVAANYQRLAHTQEEWGDHFQKTDWNRIGVEARFFLSTKRNIVRPFGLFSGMNERMESSDWDYWYGREYNRRTYHCNEFEFQVGLGLHGQLGRHIVRVEMPFSGFVQVRLGYGAALWK